MYFPAQHFVCCVGFLVPGDPKPTYTQNTRLLLETVLWLFRVHYAHINE